MGVSGCGKSTIAQALASKTGGVYLDADDFHPEANKKKMAAGIPLTDDDRWGWLDVLNAEIRRRAAAAKPLFLACSALKQVYRDRLSAGVPGVTFIYLKGSHDLIASRLAARHNHFMPSSLLDSQFATLEEPVDAVTVDVGLPLDALIEEILRRIA